MAVKWKKHIIENKTKLLFPVCFSWNKLCKDLPVYIIKFKGIQTALGYSDNLFSRWNNFSYIKLYYEIYMRVYL